MRSRQLSVELILLLIPVGLLLSAGVQILLDYRSAEQRGSMFPEVAQTVPLVADAVSAAIESESGVWGSIQDGNSVLQDGLRQIELLMEDASFVRHYAVPPLQRVRKQLFRRGSDQVYEGKQGWLYLQDEIRSVTGFGPTAWESDSDDFCALVSGFQKELQDAGIDLLVVPIPGKAAVWPEGICGVSGSKTGRPDLWLDHQVALLRDRGVEVLDLWPVLRALPNPERYYCRTDTHLSGHGIRLLADLIAQSASGQSGLASDPLREFRTDLRNVSIIGDLARMDDEHVPVSETLELHFPVELIASPLGMTAEIPVLSSSSAEILLMGDSHTLVFDAADLHAEGAGLVQQLTAVLGKDVDVVGVRGSGINGALDAVRASAAWQQRRLVVWCFTAREMTKAADSERLWDVGGQRSQE